MLGCIASAFVEMNAMTANTGARMQKYDRGRHVAGEEGARLS